MAETAEETPAETEGQAEPERPLERAVEEAEVEHSPTDRGRYSGIGNKYSKSAEYKKESKETTSKPSAKISGGLEKVLADAEAFGSEHGIDSNEILSSILAKRTLYTASGEEESAKKSVPGYEKREIPDSLDGVHAIIAFNHPETGELYFSFEKKPSTYPIARYANTLSLYGGSLGVGEPPNEGLGREIMEEDRVSYKIIIKALNETRWKVAEVKKDIDGVPSTTHVWLAYIKDPAEVRAYMSSKTLEGKKTHLSLSEMIKTKDSDFAFGFGPIVKHAGIILANSSYSNYRYN